MRASALSPETAQALLAAPSRPLRPLGYCGAILLGGLGLVLFGGWSSLQGADGKPEEKEGAASQPGSAPVPVLVNPTAEPIHPAKQGAIDKGELLGQIKYLTQPDFRGREAGTEDQRVVAQYISDEFKRYGLEPFGELKGEQRSWFQSFNLPYFKGFGPQTALEFKFGAETAKLENGKAFLPIPAGKQATKAAGKVVFAGYGIVEPKYPYDDFAKIEVAGKWVLILNDEPQAKDPKSVFNGDKQTAHGALGAKLRNCAVRRALGVLLVNGPGVEEQPKDALPGAQTRPVGDFGIPVFAILRAEADRLLAPSKKTIAGLQKAIDQDLSNQSFDCEGVEVNGISDLQYEPGTTYNVVARLEGRDPALKQEVVLIGAHSDHVGVGNFGSLWGAKGKGKVHPGADDNASGTSGLLEIAQYFGALKPEERPLRPILFLSFTGEEKGLLGSQYYADHPVVPLQNTVAMLNMDMIGRSTEGAVRVSGIGTAVAFKEIVEKHQNDPRLKVTLGREGAAPSDHTSFFVKKIPVLFFFAGFHPDYHRPTDTWEKVNASVAAGIAELAARCLLDIANLPQRPVFLAEAEQGYLGIGPDPKQPGAKGFAVGNVAANSAAAYAGLKPGDLITGLNGKPVQSADELQISMIKSKPGDKISLTVQRGQETLTLESILGSRPVK